MQKDIYRYKEDYDERIKDESPSYGTSAVCC